MKKITFSLVSALVMSVFGLQAQSWSAGTNILYSNPGTTKIGIGMTNPTELLHINGGALKIGNSTTAADRAVNMLKIGDGSYIQIGEWEADDMLSFKASKYNFTGGNIGIGTTTPQYKLDVNGYASISKIFLKDAHFVFGHSSGVGVINFGANGKLYFRNNLVNGSLADPYTDLMLLDANGNLGIGTTNPAYKLEVAMENANAIRIGKIGYTGNLNVPSGGLSAQFNIDFTGYRDINTDQIGARISALRFNAYQANSALIQKTGLAFYTNPSGTNGGTTDLQERMRINPDGNIGIGTTNPTTKLDVIGTIRAHEVKVCLNQGCDYVFDKNYNLMSISDVADYVKRNKHLPDVAPAAEMENEGINLSEMNALLLRKVEELTLYVIKLNEKIEKLEKK